MENVATDHNKYLDYIGKLPGVVNTNIVWDGDEICEVHILSDISRTPKQIVRDVQSLLMAQFQRELDHRVISIAQIDFNSAIQAASRMIIEEIALTKKRGGTEVSVVLSYNDKLFSSSQACSNDKMDIARAISQATLNAATAARESLMKFSVLDVRFVEISGDTAVLVCISLKTANGVTCRFSGSSFACDDDETAVVKATLNAINRKICAC